ncbi:MAG: germination protein Ger(x)C family [Paenibacillus sp.]|nr:germination protein Ger(x)C family [Paenibacillus sp.]
MSTACRSSSFLIGIDLDNRNELTLYASSPLFGSSHVERSSQEIELHADTIRQSRGKLEARTFGYLSYRKVQIILIGKRILEHKDWYSMLDVIMRDTKNPLTQRMVMYDGSLSEIVNMNLKEKPMLPLLLRGMIESNSLRSETVKTTLQELDRLMYEKGITPYMSEVALDKGKDVYIKGTTLLDKEGKYAVSLTVPETLLLHVLQNEVKSSISFTVRIPGYSRTGPFDTDRVSFNAEDVKTKVSASYGDGRFKFKLDIRMTLNLTERLIPIDLQKEGKRLEQLIDEQMKGRFEKLIQTIQTHRIDPIGLGLYARAYEYRRYKEVQDHWGEALSDADIQLSVKTSIRSMGPVK